MVSITASTFNTLFQDSSISDASAEALIDQAIDLLNLYGADLPNMTGTSGSKTLSVESREKGAIFLVARTVYYSFYKGVETSTVEGLTVSSPDLLSNPAVLHSVKLAARRLTELEADVG